jgi:glutaredoxin
MSPTFAFLDGHRIEVFTATWCPDCRRLDRVLQSEGIPHENVDLESVPDAAEALERATGKRGIPYLRIDGKHWVRGYHKELPSRFALDVFAAELRAAIGD